MAAYFPGGPWWGWLPSPNAGLGNGTTQLNAAANWYALSFVPDAARTLSVIRTRVSFKTGTLAAGDITCDLYDSTGTNGGPGSAIESGKTPSATITAAGWFDWTGFTSALSAAQQYWAVWKNVNASPAANFASFSNLSNIYGGATGTTLNRQDWGRATSTNTGSTWSLGTNNTCLRIGYSGGLYSGFPFYQVGAAAVGDGIYSARESGVKFTSPANVILNVIGLALGYNAQTGTPTGTARLGLWTGATPANQGYASLLATTDGASGIFSAYFGSTVQVGPSTVTRITGGETTQSDASGNRFNLNEILGDTDSNSQIIMPENGTATKTLFDGTSTWTDSTVGTSLFQYALLLDPANPFTAAGGGLKTQRHMLGGLM